MPAGWPYFAWIDPTETVFGAEHLRWDEQVFSFTLKQDEGDPASLTLAVRRPRNAAGDPIGLLGPGRKIWCWFALDCGPDLIRFRGRLVGVPTSLFEELVTLEFVARPVDVVAQKEALANTLRVLPYYDEAVIDKDKRKDPDVVLEGYTKIWHFDRETHVVTVSDEISGEDGRVDFLCANGDVLFDGLGLNLNSGPLSSVEVNAEYTWTQQAAGTVDLTGYLLSHWPLWPEGSTPGTIPCLNASDWPKHKAGLGDGWEVAESTAIDILSFATHTESRSGSLTLEEQEGGTTKVQWSFSTTGIGLGAILSGGIITNSSYSIVNDVDGDQNTSFSSSFSESMSGSAVAVQYIKATLVAGYKAARQCTEKVSFTLFADVQPILTDPQDGEALRLDNIRSVNLSGEKDATDPTPIIEDPRRRSYIATARGNQSIEHLIALARAHLMKRARVVEITFAPKLARMPEVTLRKNAFLDEPRIGQATGKIIGYSVALDGSDGQIKCDVKIGCTIGYGGAVAAVEGGPTYAEADYSGTDYQVYVGRTVLVDSSVGYSPPVAAPNDDGIDFLSTLRAENVIEVGLTVEHGPAPDENVPPPAGRATSNNPAQELIAAREAWITKYVLPQYETRAKFKLKSMTRAFETNYDIQVTDLMIPTGYDLEAV
jgi:hypothetical protein